MIHETSTVSLLDHARLVAVASAEDLSQWLGRRIVEADVKSQRAQALAGLVATPQSGARPSFVGTEGANIVRNLSAPATAIIDDWVFRTLSMADATSLDAIWSDAVGDLSMPLLEHVGDSFARKGLDLSEFTLIAVQHLLGSSVPIFDRLHELGMPYERMFIAGKLYSAHEAVLWRLSTRGANIFRPSQGATADTTIERSISDEEVLVRLVRRMVHAAVETFEQARAVRPQSRLLVIDDGGLAIRTIAVEHPRVTAAVAAMEQTRHGAKLLKSLAPGTLSFPTVNVAECRAKLQCESRLIGESVARCIEERLQEANGSWLDIGEALVVGYGSIGAAVACALRQRGIETQIFDRDAARLIAAREDRFPVIDREWIARGVGLVVGCTGDRWFWYNPANSFQGDVVLLASASTADVEFGPRSQPFLERVKFCRQVEACGPSSSLSAHSNYAFGSAGRRWLLNGGFPCNFDGSIDPIPPKDIQITRALILTGACVAARMPPSSGLIPLPVELDREIQGEFEQRRR